MTPGQTVWRSERTARLSVLVDMAAYFRAAKSAMQQAERSIYFLGWSFDPDARFAPDEEGSGPANDRIAAFLRHLACNRPEVDVRLLIWKSALPIAASQNFFPHRARKAFRGSPVRFRLDGALPLGACHHQKALIIDDRVAFCGGGDIAPDRWDTPQHLDHNPHRTRPHGKGEYPPRHEVMTVFDGGPAQALGDLFRERWRRATQQVLAPPYLTEAEIHGKQGDPWPKGVKPGFSNVRVGFARSQPYWRNHPELREGLQLHLASIAGAKTCIYMENQYLASPIIAAALATRLEEKDGPEVVLVSTQHSPSWFDQMTMDRTRLAFLKRLKDADALGRAARGGPDAPTRLHAYCPVTASGASIIVHAKLSIIDDVLLRVGSANINNRSTGFDTECDVAVEADPGPAGAAARATIRRQRTDLIAHWLGVDAPVVDAALARTGGLSAAIEALDAPKGAHRRLQPLQPKPIGPLATLISTYHLGDPTGPLDSWRPWRRRKALRAQLSGISEQLHRAGLLAPAGEVGLDAEAVWAPPPLAARPGGAESPAPLT